MIVFIIDDEYLSLKVNERVVRESIGEENVIVTFKKGGDALKAVLLKGIRPDVVFSETELPDMNGMELAKKIKSHIPEVYVIFVTEYAQYALDAFRMHADGYVLKPLGKENVENELSNIGLIRKNEKKKLRVQCFGYFEVYWKDRPLHFERKKTKELFAYLVDRRGNLCTAEEIITDLWDGETDMTKAKSNLRQLISDLKHTFSELGMENVIIRYSGELALCTDMFECDYYDVISRKKKLQDVFDGEYMSQYSWGKETEGKLFFKMKQYKTVPEAKSVGSM